MNADIATKAQSIFELTALSEDDVEAETIAVVVSRELLDIAEMFAGLKADGKIAEESLPFFDQLIAAARFFAEVLPHDPHRVLEFEGGTMPVYLAACDLCFDVIEIMEETELLPEWRSIYDEICTRLKLFALVLKEDPENLLRSA